MRADSLRARRALINPLLIAVLGFSAIATARADAVTAEAAGYTDKGYGRLVLTFSQEIKTKVRVENNIVVVDFGQPVDVAVNKIADRLKGYVQVVRHDPDKTAIRLALSAKLKVNVMEAAEKLFVDLLPQDWVGLPPGLPTEVVDELARRARVAEKQAMMKRSGPRKDWAPVKLRYALAPTFSRFSFEMSEPVKVVTHRDGQEFRITFDAPVKVDFGEVYAKLPASVVGLDADYQSDMTVVKLVLAPNAELRSFQEDAAFVADVIPADKKAPVDIEAAAKSLENAADAPAMPAPKKELAAVAPAEAPAPPSIAEKPEPPHAVPAAPAPRAGAPALAKPVADEKPAAPKRDAVFVSVTRENGTLAIKLPFEEPIAGAMFRRGDWTFLVLDTNRKIYLSELTSDTAHVVKNFEQGKLHGGQLIKLKIDANRLTSLITSDKGWTIQIGGAIEHPSRPIPARRVFAGQNRAGIFIPLAAPDRAYSVKDSIVGDQLVVITAKPPVRGLVRGQDFVDFDALASIHGVVLAPRADNLTVELSPEGVTITRPQGLEVSNMESVLPSLPEKAKSGDGVSALDAEVWQEEKKADYTDREIELARRVAEAPVTIRAEARIALARFYLAHGLASNAIGVLEAANDGEAKFGSQTSYALLHGLAELKMNREQLAFKDLNDPVLAKSPQAALLRAAALASMTRWAEARDQYNAGKNAVATLPIEVQRLVLVRGMRIMISAGDFGPASDIQGQLELIGIPPALKPTVTLLSARLALGLGRADQAASDYAELAAGPEGPAMAEARLRLVEMRVGRGGLDRPRAIEALETLSFVWRGDETEVETMRLLAKLYVAEARYRDAFNLLDAAMLVKPESETTRSFHSEMAAIFEDLFLSDRASTIEPIEALAIYYDFSKLTPIGRRGDELIRRLADRLVSVDLLDQAAELLDYQVKYRLSGVAKAQVAAKLAWVQLLNNKPANAIQALADTRIADVPQDLREQRLLLEARALSELKRFNAALELAGGMSGPEADRLRADILWSAKRWREAGEAFEKLLGERWKKPDPLDETERRDVLRAGLAFALGNETVGLSRLRDRYAAKMPEGPERTALGIIAMPSGNARKLGDVAKTLSAVDSLKLFLKLYQARFPDKPLPPEQTAGEPKKVSAR
ncbi:MAG TPA: hypothetical protein VHD34_03750 [Xanthobacteraceae bacterium]|nr:hypothetical protein [Xanthobacteraceae bacterium]